jgi:hypothetical protein
MTTLVERIVAIERALTKAELPHAFGGALALAFHTEEPRGTRDIDVNVFVPPARAVDVLAALPREVTWTDADARRLAEDGQRRVFWGDTPVDVFLDYHRFHAVTAEHVVEVPFAGTTIPILGATELAVFKAFFDRTKDWADIEAMIETRALDPHRALGWLVDLLGDDPRVERLRGLTKR